MVRRAAAPAGPRFPIWIDIIAGAVIIARVKERLPAPRDFRAFALVLFPADSVRSHWLFVCFFHDQWPGSGIGFFSAHFQQVNQLQIKST